MKINNVPNLYQPTATNEKKQIDDYAGTNKGISENTLLRQIYFGDNERFYETAAPRISLFVDTSKEEGAKALYDNEIPDELKDPDPDRANRAKAQYCFIRVDTYFYNSLFYVVFPYTYSLVSNFHRIYHLYYPFFLFHYNPLVVLY